MKWLNRLIVTSCSSAPLHELKYVFVGKMYWNVQMPDNTAWCCSGWAEWVTWNISITRYRDQTPTRELLSQQFSKHLQVHGGVEVVVTILILLFLDDLLRCKHRFCDLFREAGDSKTNAKIEPRRKKHYYPNYFPSRTITNDTFLSYG